MQGTVFISHPSHPPLAPVFLCSALEALVEEWALSGCWGYLLCPDGHPHLSRAVSGPHVYGRVSWVLYFFTSSLLYTCHRQLRPSSHR